MRSTCICHYEFLCRVCGYEALPEELCYLSEPGEVKRQEPQELFSPSTAATLNIAFLILSLSPGTQQEQALMVSSCIVSAEKNTAHLQRAGHVVWYSNRILRIEE